MLHDMSGIQIIQEHHLVFDIEIKFSTKETAQVFVDEIIKIVLCRIVLQMLHQQSAFLILFSRTRRIIFHFQSWWSFKTDYLLCLFCLHKAMTF
jgi:hypothetical protein